MDESRFDKATQRHSESLTRRRGLSLLAALGVGLALEGDDATAGKRKKGRGKKRFCKCARCHKCVKGKCRTVRDGTACSGGVCINGMCETTTEELG